MQKKNQKMTVSIILYTITAIIIVAYLGLNLDRIKGGDMFFFTTIGIFMWLLLVILLEVYQLLEEIKRTIRYNKEDHKLEFKLLKTLINQQMDEFDMLKVAFGVETPKESKKKK